MLHGVHIHTYIYIYIYREKQPPEVFDKKDFLKNWQENACSGVCFIKKRLRHKCFSCEYWQNFKNTYLWMAVILWLYDYMIYIYIERERERIKIIWMYAISNKSAQYLGRASNNYCRIIKTKSSYILQKLIINIYIHIYIY